MKVVSNITTYICKSHQVTTEESLTDHTQPFVNVVEGKSIQPSRRVSGFPQETRLSA